MAARWCSKTIGLVCGSDSNSRSSPREHGSADLLVSCPPLSIPDTPRGLHHHLAELLRPETGTAQHTRHHLVREQVFEARFIAAALKALVHDSPPYPSYCTQRQRKACRLCVRGSKI